MSALYNEIDGFAAAWLRNLASAGHIADGTVDQRSIKELSPDDCTATQCHFFAGIAGWSRALRIAGWPDDVPVWTGSCPCQPFSCAGTQRGFADERHLWPDWFRLIRECLPPVIFGEQVASKVAASWLDAVFDDLEGMGYACWAAVLPACSVGAFHRRYRIYFVAHAQHDGPRGREHANAWEGAATLRRRLADGSVETGWVAHSGRTPGRSEQFDEPGQGLRREASTYDGAGIGERGGSGGVANTASGGLRIDGGAPGDSGHAPQREPTRGMGDASGTRSGRDAGAVLGPQGEGAGERGGARGIADESVVAGTTGGLGHADESGLARARENQPGRSDGNQSCGEVIGGPCAGFWDDAIWLPCSDGKARPVEPGTEPLAHGVAGRVGRLRAYGNSIVPQVAAEFIRLSMSNFLSVPGHETQSVMHSPQSQAGGGRFSVESPR